jgi:competence protein ComEA
MKILPGITKNETSALAFLAAVFIVGVCIRSQRDRLVPVPALADTLMEPQAVVESLKMEPSGLISINRATKQELERLPGIGPVIAERIIQYRENRKGFRSLNELTKVHGIGPKKLAEMSQHLCLD